MNKNKKPPKTTTSILLRCLHMLSAHRFGVCCGVLLTFVITALNLGSSYTLKILVDDVFIKHDERWLWWIQLAFFTFVIVGTIFEIIQKRTFSKYGALAQEDLRKRLYHRVLNMDYLTAQSTNPADATTVINYNVDMLDGALSSGIPVSISSIISVVASLTVMFAIDWRLTLVSIPVYPLMIIVTRTLNNKIYSAQESALDARRSVTDDTNETLKCLVNIRVHNLFEHMTDRFGDNAARLRNSHIHINVLYTVMSKASWALIMVPYQAILYGIGGMLFFKTGNPSIGTMLIFANLTNLLIQPIMGLVNASADLSQAKAAFGEIDSTLECPLASDSPFAAVVDPINCIEAHGISFAYPGRPESVFIDFDCNIEREKSTIIWGSSGSGKSTLLKLMYGLIVISDGTGIRHADGLNFAYLPQSPQLFCLTLRENFRLVKSNISDEEIWELLSLVGLKDAIAGSEAGLSHEIKNLESSLSGGQHRRLCFAVLLASEASVLLFDEPTASLDAESSLLISNTLAEIKVRKNKTLVITTHDQSLRRIADREILL